MKLLKALKLISILWFGCFAFQLEASAEAGKNSSLPKFVTTKTSQVNARVGPGLQYPVCLVYLNKGEPVEVISEFNHWREIRDFDGEVSWVHVSLLSRARKLIVKASVPVPLFVKPAYNSKTLGAVSPKVRCDFLNYCNTDFCKVKCAGHKGWLLRKDLWGIYPSEFSQTNKIILYFKSLW